MSLSPFPKALLTRAENLLALYRDQGLMLATAESCTGGLVAGLLTEIAGSSDVVERGFVTYSNAAKQECLGVPEAVITGFGAVSQKTARAMAEGALLHSKADVAVAVTGIAGPGGGSAAKPVGLVHFGCARKGRPTVTRVKRFGAISRDAIRFAAIGVALDLLFEAVA